MLSVIMPVYNEKIEYIKQSVYSILHQTYTNFEFIIIDDNPDSNIIRKYLENIDRQYAQIRILFHKKNHGIVKSLNDGIKYARGNIIVRLDADDISVNTRISSQLKFMKKNKLDFVSSNASTIDGNNRLIKSNMYGNYPIINQDKLKYILGYCYNISIHPTWMFKKKIWKSLYGYRNVPCAEDFDFLVRAIIKGYKFGYQPDVVLYKRVRRNSLSSSNLYDQFISVFIIKKFIRKSNWQKILKYENFNKYYIKYTSSNQKKKFNKFIKSMYSFFEDKNIFKLIDMLYKLVLSKESIWFVINAVLMKKRQKKLKI